jgi:hypothetical protein
MQSVSVAEITYQPSFSAELLSAASFVPPLPKPHDSLLVIDVPAFGIRMQGEITDFDVAAGYRDVTFESFVDAGVSALLTLRSEYSNGVGSDLQIKAASLSLRVNDHRPRTHFIANTLYAMLGLAGPVKVSIPGLNIDLGLHFTMPPSEVAAFLQGRQTYFGLMVIEKGTGLKFDIPPHISGEEMNSIAFAYHAIAARQFIWLVNDITQPTPANEEMLAWFNNLQPAEPNGCTYTLQFGPSQEIRRIFGQDVPLGDQTVFIVDGLIENCDDLLRELAKNDGHVVPITIRPRGRRGRYVFTNAPRLPDNPWDEKIEGFIKLEEMLNERLAARYHKLAASTVADLTPDEMEVVTTPPKLDDDAFQMRD